MNADDTKSPVDTPLLGDAHRDAVVLDAHTAPCAEPERSIDEVARQFFESSPPWLERLMLFRNAVVGRLGFDVGSSERTPLPDRFEPDMAFGPFEVLDRSDDEIVLGSNDKRFSLRISIWKPEPNRLVLSTVGTPNDAIGKAYLQLVKIPHGPIAGMMTKRMAAQ